MRWGERDRVDTEGACPTDVGGPASGDCDDGYNKGGDGSSSKSELGCHRVMVNGIAVAGQSQPVVLNSKWQKYVRSEE